MRGRTGIWVAIVIALLGPGIVSGETMDRIVANVNGDIILNSELQERIRNVQKAMPDVVTSDPEKIAEIQRSILQQMIREKLTETEVKRLKIVVSARDLEDTIDQLKKESNFTDAQFEYMVQQNGQTLAQFKDGVKKELERSRLLDRVLKSKTIITDSEVDAFLKTGNSDAGEKRRMAVIFLPYGEAAEGKQSKANAEKLARDILSRLRGGADFAKMAREYSKGPVAEEGGDLGFVEIQDLTPAIAAATKNLKINEVSDPVDNSNGYYILKVLDVQRDKVNTSDAGVRDKARRQLLQQELTKKFETWIKDLERRAFIQISL